MPGSGAERPLPEGGIIPPLLVRRLALLPHSCCITVKMASVVTAHSLLRSSWAFACPALEQALHRPASSTSGTRLNFGSASSAKKGEEHACLRCASRRHTHRHHPRPRGRPDELLLRQRRHAGTLHHREGHSLTLPKSKTHEHQHDPELLPPPIPKTNLCLQRRCPARPSTPAPRSGECPCGRA